MSTSTPILFVKKKDGSLWLCIDYCRLNLLIKKNWYPLPLIGEALDWLSGAKIYTKLDIQVAYNQVWMKEGDKWKTTFWTWYRHYKYYVMPFRLANALATFQGFINYALQDLLDICCIAYLDDILIYSDDDAEHMEHVWAILKCLQEYGLYVVVRTVPPDQVRLIGSMGLDSGLVLVERSVKEWVGVLRDSACGLLRTVLHTRQGLY